MNSKVPLCSQWENLIIFLQEAKKEAALKAIREEIQGVINQYRLGRSKLSYTTDFSKSLTILTPNVVHTCTGEAHLEDYEICIDQ